MSQKGLVETPLDEYRNIFESAAFSDEARERILSVLPDSEKNYLKKHLGDGIVADMLCLKLKLKHELELFQDNFSSSKPFLQKVRAIAESNRAVVTEHVGRLEQGDLAEKWVRAAEQVKMELGSLLEEQDSVVATIADVVGADMQKSAKEDEKRQQERLEQQAAKTVDGAPAPVDPDAPPPIPPKNKAVAASMGILLFAIVLSGLLFYDDIVDMTLSPDAAVAEIKPILPVVSAKVSRKQLLLVIEDSAAEDDAKLMEGANRALATAMKHSFTGVFGFSQSGERLFITGQSAQGPRVMSTKQLNIR